MLREGLLLERTWGDLEQGTEVYPERRSPEGLANLLAS